MISQRIALKLQPGSLQDVFGEYTAAAFQGGNAVAAFRGIRDFVAFADKRLIVVNVQGMTPADPGSQPRADPGFSTAAASVTLPRRSNSLKNSAFCSWLYFRWGTRPRIRRRLLD
ncbi:PH domain-containing protein [Arthrobacter sp. Marseille-P9274]|uniref:PH domain-containing protein n=1 Tax=Arthrobacter sp. Marseille-P9274 TaxID=2866572 RepID=UPI0034D2A039